jgi:molybdopterin molybdotransferase
VTQGGMISVAEAHARLMALFEPLEVETVRIEAAAGRVLARDLFARRTQPPLAVSAMDGYALRAREARAGARLRIAGESAAGRRHAAPLETGEAVRIFTGAPVPETADTVVIQEDTERYGDVVILREGAAAGDNIRPAGADFAEGARLAAPRRLGPADAALIAAMNIADVPVARRPVIAIIATGDELVMPGEELGPDQIVASNHLALKAMFEARGAEARVLPIARDTAESLAACFSLAEGADAIVTIGGASVGDYDLVQSAAMTEGLELEFYKVAIRPGKPLMAGRLRGMPLVGLPGNPVSAIVCAQIFLLPAIDRMLGLPSPLATSLPARLGAPLGPNGPREAYLRSRVTPDPGGWICTAFDRQDSSLLTVLAEANALLVRRPGDPARQAGDAVEFLHIW